MNRDELHTAHEIVADYLRQLDGGVAISEEDVIAEHPQLEEELLAEFRSLNLITDAVAETPDQQQETLVAIVSANEEIANKPWLIGPAVRCPHCNSPNAAELEGSIRAVKCEDCGKQFSLIRDRDWPKRIKQYELLERIGMGGFGSVWKAQDHELDLLVAIKLPRRSFLEEEDAQQFLREARTAANLNHPNIVKFHNVGVFEGSIFIASELIDGEPLSQHIGNGLTEKEAIQLAEPLARALEYAHKQGVIHRDLKPQNVILGSNGNPYLSDFGLARRGESDLTVTMSGQILGTPGYMSPEQARGDSHNADARSDIYSFGIVLYELLTGQVPFTGAPETVFVRIQNEEPVNPRRLNHSISRDIDTICMKCLEKDPEKRYQAAGELAEELDRLATGKAILARPVGIGGRAARWVRRNPVIAMLTAGLAAAFIATCLLGSYLIAQKQFTEGIARQESLTKIRHLRSEAKFGYRDRIFQILMQNNGELVRDKELEDELRTEALLCLGDFAAHQLHELNFDDTDKLSDAAVSSDGSRVAISFDSGRIEIRNAADLKQVVYETNVDDVPMAMHFQGDPSHQQLLSIGKRGGLHSIALASEAVVHKLPQIRERPLNKLHELGGEIVSASFSADGQFVVFTDGRAVVVWSMVEGKEVFEEIPEQPLIPNTSVIRCVAISANGEQVAVGHSDVLGGVGGVIRWDRLSGDVKWQRLTGAQDRRSITISDDGNWVAVGAEQSILFGMKTLERRLFFQDTEVFALAFRPNSNYLAIDYTSGIVEIRNYKTNSLVARINHPYKSFNDGVAFSRDGSRFIVWNEGGIKSLALDHHSERIQVDVHERAVPGLQFTADGRQLVSWSKDGSVRFWDPSNGKQNTAITGLGQIQCVAIHPTEPWIAVASWKNTDSLTIWELSDKQELPAMVFSVPNNLGMICGLGFTSDGKYLAASGDNGLETWSVGSSRGTAMVKPYWPTHKPEALQANAEQNRDEQDKFLVFDNSGQRLFHANVWGDDIKYLDLRTTPPESGHLGGRAGRDMLIGWHGLSFTPNNELVFVTPDNSLDIWDVEDMSSGGRRIRSIAIGAISDSNVAANKNGLLAAKTGPKTVTVWDLATDGELYTFREERNTVYSLAWSPKGTKLAVGLSDGGISIWDLSKVKAALKSLGFAK